VSTVSRCDQSRTGWESHGNTGAGPSIGRECNRPHRLTLLAVIALTVLLAGCRPSAEPESELALPSPSLSHDDLRRNLDEILEFTYRDRHFSFEQHAAWQILHGVLAYQRDFLVEHDGTEVRAVDYLLEGGPMKGWDLEVVVDERAGRRGLRAMLELGSQSGQGHTDQWLANLAQSGLSLDQTLRVGDQTVTMRDWVTQSQLDVPRNVIREYSWTLLALSPYMSSNATWTASDGQTWSIERLVQIEADQELDSSACGGTHRLIGLTKTLARHRSEGGKMEGAWAKADEVIQQAIAVARRYQNPDGSFSTRYFESPGSSPDLAQNLGNTGHTLEFLVMALADEQLNEPWVRNAVTYLCDTFRLTRDVPVECGVLYHAAHGLILFRARVFGPRSYAMAAPVSVSQPRP
jgi:hypothetical protein